MKRLTILQSKLIALPTIARDVVRDTVEENKHFIEDKNTDQLSKGLRSDGSKIEPEYKPLTKKIKALKGQPHDRVTLKDTGDFYSGIKAQVDSVKVELFATDPKSDMLQQKYGNAILGLSDDSIKEIIDDVLKPSLLDKIKKILMP